jgi:hypothetical protein
MILTEKVKVKIRKDNIEHFLKKGYNAIIKDIIEVKVEDLQIKSNRKLLVKCDICGKEYELQYYKYNINKDRCGYFSCKSCSKIKRDIVNIERYGTRYPIQKEEFKKKRELTNISRYGEKCPLQNKEVKKRSKETLMNIYGVDNISKNKDIQNRKIETNLKKYGETHPFKNEEIKEKQRQTVNYLYGCC